MEFVALSDKIKTTMKNEEIWTQNECRLHIWCETFDLV